MNPADKRTAKEQIIATAAVALRGGGYDVRYDKGDNFLLVRVLPSGDAVPTYFEVTVKEKI